VAEKLLKYEIQADVKGRESNTGLADDLDDIAKVLGGEGSKQAPAAAAHLRELPSRTRQSPRSRKCRPMCVPAPAP
jgi:hypothetical protein